MSSTVPAPVAPSGVRSPLIIVVGADKGGVGKTTIARTLIDYVARLNVPLRAFDTEPGDEGVLRRFHPQVTEMLNAASAPGQMRIVDAAQPGTVTLVDARAGLFSTILKAFDRIKLLDDVRSGALRVLGVHVVGSSVASAGEIEGVIAALRGASLLRVNNHIREDAAIPPAAPGENVVEVAPLEETAVEAVDAAGVGFAAFAGDTTRSRVLRGLVGAWETDVHAAYDAAGIGRMITGA